jgi:hypothetical protein
VTVTAAQIMRALDELLDANAQVTRSLLGVGNHPGDLAVDSRRGSLPPARGSGWFQHGPGIAPPGT